MRSSIIFARSAAPRLSSAVRMPRRRTGWMSYANLPLTCAISRQTSVNGPTVSAARPVMSAARQTRCPPNRMWWAIRDLSSVAPAMWSAAYPRQSPPSAMWCPTKRMPARHTGSSRLPKRFRHGLARASVGAADARCVVGDRWAATPTSRRSAARFDRPSRDGLLPTRAAPRPKARRHRASEARSRPRRIRQPAGEVDAVPADAGHRTSPTCRLSTRRDHGASRSDDCTRVIDARTTCDD